MSQDVRDVLQVLRFELNYLEQGGFQRDRALLGAESPFQGTFACLNYGDPLSPHACHECVLHQFVPVPERAQDVPCHYIPLNSAGETVAGLIAHNEPERLTTELRHWLRQTIATLEANTDGAADF